MHPAYTTKLGLCARKIDVGIQKIDRSHLDIFGIVIANCLVNNKLKKIQFFQKSFLLANIGLEVVLGMLFLTFSRANIQFAEQEFVLRTYTAIEALLITKRVEIIDKKKFTVEALNEDNKIFVIYIAALVELITMLIYSFHQAQIALLTSEETRISAEYSNFSNVFFSDSAAELPEYTGINNHLINVLDNKQPSYSSIYSLKPVELKMLKIYIKANLTSNFIRPSKSPASTSILFV